MYVIIFRDKIINVEIRIDQQQGIYLITIEIDGFEVTLSNLGASFYAIKLDDIDMILQTVRVSDFTSPSLYYGKTIGRVCGRLPAQEYSLKGYRYRPENNDNGASLHGGFNGLSTKLFSYQIKQRLDGADVIFDYLSPHDDAGYPGNLGIKVIYKVYKNFVRLEYECETDTPTLVALTNHAHFCLGESDKDNLLLQFKANKCIETDEKLLPIKLIDIPDKWKMDEPKSLSNTGDIDSFFLLEEKKVVLQSEDYKLTINSDFEGIQVYTDNFISDAIVTTSDKNQYRSIALEPEDNQLDRRILNPKEKYQRYIEYRFEKVMKNDISGKYEEHFNKKPEGTLESGGRFEMLGNHTDHNHGKTLASTCSLTIKAAFSKEKDNLVKFISKGVADFEISLDDTSVIKEEQNSPKCFIRGIADYFKKNGFNIGGFSIYMESTIPAGSGVSSSAAFEVLLGKVFNKLYNNDEISILDICKAGQYAENNYFGKNSGLLDQIACASMGISYIDFENIEKPEIEILHETFDGYQFVIVDTGKSHADLSDLYSSIPNDMLSAAKKMGHNFLREGSLEELQTKTDLMTDSEYRRAVHFYNENERVEKALICLKNRDFAGYFECVRASEKSSRELLGNAMVNDVYEGSLAEAIDIANEAMDNEGACKINGGGYGGTIICIVPDNKINSFLETMTKKYGCNHVFLVSSLNK